MLLKTASRERPAGMFRQEENAYSVSRITSLSRFIA